MSKPPLNEQLLIDILYARNKRAFSFLHDTYSPSLHGSIIDLMADKDIAEDVLKKAFVAAYFTIAQCKGRKGKLYAWLSHVTLRMVFEIMRVMQEWPTASQLQEASCILCSVLNRMDAPSREIIRLIYYKGYSKSQVAKRLHIRVDIVDALLQTGLKRLQQYLNEYHWEWGDDAFL